MALVRYQNTSTLDIVDRLEVDPGLEALSNWRRVYVEGDTDPEAEAAVQEAIDRAKAERESIVAAQRLRDDEAALRAEQALQISQASASLPVPAVHPNVTASHSHQQFPSTGPVLSRAGQGTGPTRDELVAQEAADSAAIHAMGEDARVLKRLAPAKTTPPRKALERKAVDESAAIHASGVGVLHPEGHVRGNTAAEPVLTETDPAAGEDVDEDVDEVEVAAPDGEPTEAESKTEGSEGDGDGDEDGDESAEEKASKAKRRK